jgi:hypothetical protein
MYDLANREMRREQLDGGIQRAIVDAAGNLLEHRDAKGALVLHASDALGRLIRAWARDTELELVTLRERTIYGDERDRTLAVAVNQLGRIYRTNDEAGLAECTQYDFKGNLLESTRQVISDAQILQVFAAAPGNNWHIEAYRVQWDPGSTSLDVYAATALDATPYVTSTRYDALNRAKALAYPRDVQGNRLELRPSYNEAGALERVDYASGSVCVERIAYNAKGQRTLIVYGNGIMTRYRRDPRTFRLMRLRSESSDWGRPSIAELWADLRE